MENKERQLIEATTGDVMTLVMQITELLDMARCWVFGADTMGFATTEIIDKMSSVLTIATTELKKIERLLAGI